MVKTTQTVFSEEHRSQLLQDLIMIQLHTSLQLSRAFANISIFNKLYIKFAHL